MSVFDFLSQPLWQRLAITLLHFVWQGLLIAVLLYAMIRLFRLRSGQTRYVTLVCGFAVLMICPMVTFFVLDRPVVTMSQSTTSTDLTRGILPAFTQTRVILHNEPLASRPMAVTHTDAIEVPQENRVMTWNTILPWGLLVWITGVLVLSVRLLLGFIGVHGLKRDLEPLPIATAQRITWLSEKLGLSRKPGMILHRVQRVLGIITPEKSNHLWLAGAAGIALLAIITIMASGHLLAGEQIKDQVGGYMATLASGATVELIGVTHLPMTVPGRVGGWWKPDGALLHDPLFDSVDFKYKTFEDWETCAFYAVALKFHANPRYVRVIKWEASEALYIDSIPAKKHSTWVYQDGIRVAGIQCPKTVEKTVLRVGIESGHQGDSLEWVEFKDVALRLDANGEKETATLGRIVGQLSPDVNLVEGRIGLLGLPHMDYSVTAQKNRGPIRADANGAFVIEDISPGWYELGTMVQSSGFTDFQDELNMTGGAYSSSFTYTIRKPVQVKTGETLRVTLGFEGRDVLGRFVLPEDSPYPSIPFGILDGVEAFYTAGPKIQENRPVQYAQMSRKERQQWQQQWYKSEEYIR